MTGSALAAAGQLAAEAGKLFPNFLIAEQELSEQRNRLSVMQLRQRHRTIATHDLR